MARPINSIRKITRVGRSKSFSVIIPIAMIRQIGWREKQRVIVKRIPRGFMIIDAKTKKKKKLTI
ncbi:hypothetical protein A3C67_02715 [Candidatus Nomurabacteria bacterium RIFCSPHIGHO2_02_FULL_42_19]|uniref:SpoVT-AbrB domain-containing protein n=1 Tax=Candidatus Nomurabacteria bacterium RIFCSPHIGHO2_02_FULL_42_19 TaxID=1801756 RepID=A0A1F6W1C7_9BACT|nr:MAG: hypothetical protein A3C67_02715 [Candidatus Nomurabacteria bacterium RIFCSPHIGHO2_02_FULL_42_19]